MTTETHKTCPACERALPTAMYKKNAAAKDGLYSYCKDCTHTRRKTPQVGAVDLTTTAPALTGKPAGIPANLLNGLEVPATTVSPCEGVWQWRTPKGWCVFAVHYSADPTKRPGTPDGDAWLAAEKAKSSPRDWQREMEIDHTISEGEPFFSTFNRGVHIRPCAFDPTLPLLRGWDFGRGHPACVFAQKTPTNQIRVLHSVLESQKDIFHFAPLILAETNVRFPGANVVDYGDPAGAQETDKGATTAILLDQFDITLHYRFSFNEEGLKMMERALMVREDGEPGLVLDPTNIILIDGFAGGYKLDTGVSGKDTEGRLKNSPKKDGWFDHLMDALRYLFVNVFSVMPNKQDTKKSLEALSLWRTNEQQKQLLEDAGDTEFFA